MQSAEDLILFTQNDGSITLSTDSHLQSEKNITTQVAELVLQGKMEAKGVLNLTVEKSLILGPESQCHAVSGIYIKALALRDIRGNIVSDTFIQITAQDKIYIHGNAVILASGEENGTSIGILAKSMLCSDRSCLIAPGSIKLNMQDKLIIDKKSQLSAKEIVTQAPIFKNESPNIQADECRIFVRNKLINYSTGVIRTKEKLVINGDSLWNTGQLYYGQDLMVTLNKVFAHGVVDSSEIYKNLRERNSNTVTQACIQGQNAVVIAGVFMNLGGMVTANNWTLNGIAEFNLMGITNAVTESKTRIISFDGGIHVPNIHQIGKNMADFVGSIQKGHYKEALTAIFSWNGFFKGASFVRWILREFLPALGKPIDLGWSVLLTIKNMPTLYHDCKALYRSKEREPHQFYRLISVATNTAIQGVSIDTQMHSFIHGPWGSIKWITPSHASITLTGDFASLILPIDSSNAVVDIKAGGFQSNATLQNYTGMSYSVWNLQVALNVSDIFLCSNQDNNVMIANNLSETGQHLQRSGTIIANNNFVNVQTDKENGSTIAHFSLLNAKHLEEGKMNHLKTDALVVNGDEIDTNGKTEAHVMGLTAGTVKLSSHNVITEALIINGNEIDTNGQTEAHVMDLTADTINMSGDNVIGQEVLKAKTIYSRGETVFEKSDEEHTATWIADEIKMSTESHVTGKGTLYLDAKKSDLCQLDVDNLYLQEDHIDNVEDLLLLHGSYANKNIVVRNSLSVSTKDDVVLFDDMNVNYSVNLTASSIAINNNIHSDQNLFITSTDGDIYNLKNATANGQLGIDSHGGYRNEGGTVCGTVTSIHTQNDAINNGGTWAAAQYLQIISDNGSIINHTIDLGNGNDDHKVTNYKVRTLLGGTGEGYNGIGTYIKAGNQVLNEGTITSTGDNYIMAKNDIISHGQTYTYISYEKHWKELFLNKTTMEFTTEVNEAGIYSTKGNNTLVSTDGSINSCSTQFVASRKTYLSSKNDMPLTGYVASTRCYKDQNNLFYRDTQKQMDEYVVPTVIISTEGTNLVTQGDVQIEDAIILGGGLYIEARNVDVSPSILNHEYQETSQGFSLQLPNINSIPGYSVYQDTVSLYQEKGSTETALGSSNLALDTTNTLNNIIASFRKNTLTPAFCPTVGLDYSKSKTTTHWQTTASNVGIYCDSMKIEAEGTVSFNNGVQVMTTGDSDITCNWFEQNGAVLHNFTKSDSEGMTGSTTLAGDLSMGVHTSHSTSEQTLYSNQTFKVGGNFNIHAHQWKMQDANVYVGGSLTGKVDDFSVISHLNTSTNSSWSAKVSTMSDIRYQQSSGRRAWVGVTSGIQTGGDLDFETNTAYMEGAKITAGGQNHFTAQHLTTKDVHSYNESHSYGISGSVNDLVSPSCGQAIPLFDVNYGKTDYQANQISTIYGTGDTFSNIDTLSGNLNTQNADGLTITRNDHFNY